MTSDRITLLAERYGARSACDLLRKELDKAREELASMTAQRDTWKRAAEYQRAKRVEVERQQSEAEARLQEQILQDLEMTESPG